MLFAALGAGAPPSFAIAQEEHADDAVGAIVPLERNDLELTAVRLGVRVIYKRFSMDAEYVLRNAGARKEVLFGIPMEWPAAYFNDAGPLRPLDGAVPIIDAGVDLIELAVDSKAARCRATFDGPRNGLVVKGWCSARLSIPHAESVRVRVRSAGHTVPGPDPQGVAGRIRFEMAATGLWSGPVPRVAVTVDLSQEPHRRFKVVSPPGAVQTPSGLFWEFHDVRLDRLGDIVIDWEKDDGQGDRVWVRAPIDLEAAASSTLRPQGRYSYEARNVVDGDRATGWCEGVQGDGLGQTVEVSFRQTPAPGCRLLDIEIIPGLARNAQAYVTNGRVSRARFENCETPSRGFDVDLTRSANVSPGAIRAWPGLADIDRFDDPAQEISVPEGALGQDPRCVRMIIKGVRKGTSYPDTCISELTPRVYCPPKQAPEPPAPEGATTARKGGYLKPVELSEEERQCALRINARVADVANDRPDAWPKLLAACRCAKKSARGAPLAWRRCEITHEVVKEYPEFPKMNYSPGQMYLRHLAGWAEETQAPLVCTDPDQCEL
jgi:hypothetical protein